MADFSVSKFSPSRTGSALTKTTLASGNNYYFVNDGATLFLIDGGSASQTLTITPQATVDGLTLPNRVITVGVGAELYLSLDPNIYNITSGVNAGRVLMTATGTTDIKVTAIGSV